MIVVLQNIKRRRLLGFRIIMIQIELKYNRNIWMVKTSNIYVHMIQITITFISFRNSSDSLKLYDFTKRVVNRRS